MAPTTRTDTKAAKALLELKNGVHPKKDQEDKKRKVTEKLLAEPDVRAALKKKIVQKKGDKVVEEHVGPKPKRRVPSSGEPTVRKTTKTKTTQAKAPRSKRVQSATA